MVLILTLMTSFRRLQMVDTKTSSKAMRPTFHQPKCFLCLDPREQTETDKRDIFGLMLHHCDGPTVQPEARCSETVHWKIKTLCLESAAVVWRGKRNERQLERQTLFALISKPDNT